jgi:hypothetical protein
MQCGKIHSYIMLFTTFPMQRKHCPVAIACIGRQKANYYWYVLSIPKPMYCIWRKIQNLGLSKEHKKSDSDVSKWLHDLSGLAFPSPEEVADCFTEELVQYMPNDKRVNVFC